MLAEENFDKFVAVNAGEFFLSHGPAYVTQTALVSCSPVRGDEGWYLRRTYRPRVEAPQGSPQRCVVRQIVSANRPDIPIKLVPRRPTKSSCPYLKMP